MTTNNTEDDIRMNCPHSEVEIYCEYGCDDDEDCPFNQKEELPINEAKNIDNEISDLIARLTGEYSVGVDKEFGTRKFFVPPIAIEAANRIKELQERLDCIKELLDDALRCPYWIAKELGTKTRYNSKKVNQAHRIASGGELPKRVRE